MAEQADAHDSKSCSFGIEGSIPSFGITLKGRRALVRDPESLWFGSSEPLYHSSAGTRPLLVLRESASMLSRFDLPSPFLVFKEEAVMEERECETLLGFPAGRRSIGVDLPRTLHCQ